MMQMQGPQLTAKADTKRQANIETNALEMKGLQISDKVMSLGNRVLLYRSWINEPWVAPQQ
jgi:hypothetical protein